MYLEFVVLMAIIYYIEGHMLANALVFLVLSLTNRLNIMPNSYLRTLGFLASGR
jgi:hypothetical protein